MRTNRVYDVETKLKVAKSIVEDGLSVQEVMDEFKIKSPTQVHTWSRQYRSGGIDALKPKPKGRRKKQPKAYTNREEELEARVKELELELEIQKRINALAEELGQE